MPVSGDVVADGRVDADKLRELLDLGAEQEALDFKSTIDFSNQKNRIDHIKDLIAMMSLETGGYVVVGVNDNGTVAADQAEIVTHLFDSATLTQKVSAYVDGRVDIRSAIHELPLPLGGIRKVALIYAGPPPGMFPLVITKIGEYVPAPGKQLKVAFREGQVIIRNGTTTTTLGAQYWERILGRYRAKIEADARRGADALMSRVVNLLEQAERGGEPATPLDAEMDLTTFATAAAHLIESGSVARLDQFLVPTLGELQARVSRSDYDGASSVLDRVFTLAATAMLYGNAKQFDSVMDALARHYNAIPQISDAIKNTSPSERQRASAWLDILVRLYALGGLAVRRQKWAELRSLVLRPYEVTPTYGYASWLRHAVTSAARADVLTPPDDERTDDLRGAAVISRARLVSLDVPQLRPDLPDELAASELLLNSLCQFDILWCLIAQSVTGRPNALDFYPSSSELNQNRADPAFDLIATSEQARHALFPDLNNSEVVEVVQYVYGAAERQSWNHNGLWVELPGAFQLWAERVASETPEH